MKIPTSFLLLILGLSIFIITACSKTLTKEDCQLAVFSSYKGSPKAANLLKTKCQDYLNLEYSHEKCQSSLVRLMAGDSEMQLKKQFGARIMECFTENDLARFLNKTSTHVNENK